MFLFALMLLAAPVEDSTVVETTALVDAPVEQVWAAFSTAEGLQDRKDGKLGDGGTIVHTVAAFDPLHLLVWKPARPPAKFPFKAAWLKTWNVLYFAPTADGRTQVTNRMLGYDASADSQKMRAFFVAGNRETLEALQKHFAAGPTAPTKGPP